MNGNSAVSARLEQMELISCNSKFRRNLKVFFLPSLLFVRYRRLVPEIARLSTRSSRPSPHP